MYTLFEEFAKYNIDKQEKIAKPPMMFSEIKKNPMIF